MRRLLVPFLVSGILHVVPWWRLVLAPAWPTGAVVAATVVAALLAVGLPAALLLGRRRGIEGAMVAIDPSTGDIRAMVGGREYERGNFNRAINARRQPGSAFKPFVYAAALSAGMTPATEVDDEPIEVDVDRNKVWRPQNFDDEYLGRTTLRRALMKSANAATVRVSRSVGEPRVIDAARRNGIGSPLGDAPSIASASTNASQLSRPSCIP